MFYESDKVKTNKEVTASQRDILVLNDIKPGTIGTVLKSVTIVTVNFDGKIVELDEDSLVPIYDNTNRKECNGDLNAIKDLFGFK